MLKISLSIKSSILTTGVVDMELFVLLK